MVIENGFSNIIKDLAKLKVEREKELQSLPFECEVIDQLELNKLIEVRKKLEGLCDAYDSAVQRGASSAEKQDFFEQVLKNLDQFVYLWDSKFTTADTDDDNVHNHSVYYVTGSGVSLRLKRINLEKKGLRGCVEPFMEKIFFELLDGNGVISEKPVVGGYVMEFLSQEFSQLQKLDGNFKEPFKSKIRKYMEDGSVVFIECVKNAAHKHNGHQVNKIMFENRQQKN
jgi:hypothetical protein